VIKNSTAHHYPVLHMQEPLEGGGGILRKPSQTISKKEVTEINMFVDMSDLP
jgi:hypothetical protein